MTGVQGYDYAFVDNRLPKPPRYSDDWWAWAFAELSKPIDEAFVERTTKEKTHKKYDTTAYKYIALTQRLNEVLGIDGWRVAFETIDKTEGQTKHGQQTWTITCACTVEIETGKDGLKVTRTAVGGHTSMGASGLADAYKGAHTNALKKCLALFGVGWKVYAGMVDDDAQPLPEQEDVNAALKDVAQKLPIDRAAYYREMIASKQMTRIDALKMMRDEIKE